MNLIESLTDKAIRKYKYNMLIKSYELNHDEQAKLNSARIIGVENIGIEYTGDTSYIIKRKIVIGYDDDDEYFKNIKDGQYSLQADNIFGIPMSKINKAFENIDFPKTLEYKPKN